MNAKVAVKQVLNTFQPKPRTVLAVIGDGFGNVEIAGSPGFVYIRVRGVLTTAFNAQVPNLHDLPVVCGYEYTNPRLFQVLAVYIASDTPYRPNVPPHHETHEYMAEGGGYDVVWVDLRQIMPFLVSTTGGLSVFVHRGIVWRNGAWRLVESENSYDLTSYVPGAGARFLLIALNAASGAITFKAGTTVADKNDLDFTTHCPVADPGTKPLAAVRLYTGQTEIQEERTRTDIVDLRFPEYVGGTPGAVFYGSSGSELGESPTRFFWDATNQALILNGNSILLPGQQAQGGLHLDDNDGKGGALTIGRFASNPFMSGYRANTSRAAPSAVVLDDILFRLSAFGYGATAFSSGSRARIDFKASENWSDTAQGTCIDVWATPPGGAAAQVVMRICGDGSVYTGSPLTLVGSASEFLRQLAALESEFDYDLTRHIVEG